MRDKLPSSGSLGWMIAGSSILLFLCSSARHALFQSGAFDLGFFDQAVYLISQGQIPVISFWGYPVLGGHADWILYLLAPLYRISANIHWLFAIQGISLAIAALPLYHLAKHAGLKPTQARAIAAAYLLYPLVFNLNLFDFHPEVIAMPLFFAVVLAARKSRMGWFVVGILVILGCRAALSLTVAAMGIWLLLFEQRRWCGAIALIAGSTWFLVATQVVIPAFRPAGVESVRRYAFLGDSVLEIVQNLFLKPDLILGRVFSLGTLEYLVLLLAPVFWGLSWRHLAPLVVALPTLAINILSNSPAQRDLVHQYSLPVLPFLLLAIIAALAEGKTWFRRPRTIVLWSLIGFLTLAKYSYLGTRYLRSLDTWTATREAIALIQTPDSVLTTHEIVPHLTHRAQINFPNNANVPFTDPSEFRYVLLNLRHPGWVNTPESLIDIIQQLQANPRMHLQYRQDAVYLFVRQK